MLVTFSEPICTPGPPRVYRPDRPSPHTLIDAWELKKVRLRTFKTVNRRNRVAVPGI